VRNCEGAYCILPIGWVSGIGPELIGWIFLKGENERREFLWEEQAGFLYS
jgi:hypothetical protein